MLRNARERLRTARRQRQLKEYRVAQASLGALLKEDLPADIWQTALLELALMAQDENDLPRALQVYSQYLTRWPEDVNVPEVLLRQGLICRQLGLNNSAISKFYTVMTSALALKGGDLDRYQKLVLQAQVEIAETYFVADRVTEAKDALEKLLKLKAPNLNREQIHYRLLCCLSKLGLWDDLVLRAQDYIRRYEDGPAEWEVRFLLATAYKTTNRKTECEQQILEILKVDPKGRKNVENLAYWQQRTGNELANRFYQEGEFLTALDIYLAMIPLNDKPEWQFPVLYQAGLIYERLNQLEKAGEYYRKILARQKDLGQSPRPSLEALVSLARWRNDLLSWEQTTEAGHRQLRSPASASNTAPETPTRAAL